MLKKKYNIDQITEAGAKAVHKTMQDFVEFGKQKNKEINPESQMAIMLMLTNQVAEMIRILSEEK